MKTRTANLVLLICLAAMTLLLGGSWLVLVRPPATEGFGRRAQAAVGRLLRGPRHLGVAALALLRERAPQLGDLLGLAEPQVPVRVPLSVPPVATSQHRAKTGEELRAESLIETAFQEYFRDFMIAGRSLIVRMPFALNGEREDGRGYSQDFHLDGKGTPARLWPYIDSALSSKGFARYAAQVASPGEKVIVFSLPRRAYQVSSGQSLLEAVNGDAYPGTPTRIFVRRQGGELSEADVYNYLYAVAVVGVDCSGFTYHILESVASGYGLELDRALAKSLRARPREVRKRIGMWFFDPAQGYTERVGDRIEDLRPADLLLFRGRDGAFKHSAVIQSIDLENGIIRYVQSTDWASEAERGVHLSTIRFDPSRTGESLDHYSVRWLQQVRPPFAGEQEPRNWRSDRDRYLWYTEAGGSMVVRLRLLVSTLLAADSRFYTPVGAPPGAPGGEQPPPEQAPTACGTEAPLWLSRSP